MFDIDHQVRVFVFQVAADGVEYLLLRQKPRAEWPFGPVIGTVRPDEHLQDTIMREVLEETGLQRPMHILDLLLPQKELFGDVGLVEWPFAYQAGGPSTPVTEVVPGPTIGEYAWMRFEQAYQEVGSEKDRDTLVRLQLELAG